jgi:hypothetical protein
MLARCENCGQAALENDKVCWHCGRPLAGRDPDQPDKVAVKKGWQQTQSIGAAGGYIAMAVLVVLATILVTRLLGEQPRVAASVGERPPDGWETIQDFSRTFTFYLQEEWSWFEPTRREQRSDPTLETMLANNALFLLGTHPFGAEVEDMEIVFLATEIMTATQTTTAAEPAEAFLLVARSAQLNGLTYEEVTEFLQSSSYRILEVGFVEELDNNYIRVLVETPVEEGLNFAYWRCRQQFFLGREESLLVTACAKDTIYTAYQRPFNTILTSFRRLS